MKQSPAFTLETGSISDETKEIALKELRETPENVAKGLQELKELLKSDSTINYITDDAFLILFLRPCKYYAESAYKLMKNITEFKYKVVPFGLFPEHVKEPFTTYDLINLMANRDQKGRRVFICKFGSNWDPAKVSADQLLLMCYLLQLAALLEPQTQVRGIAVIVDMKGFGWKQLRGFNLGFFRNSTEFSQEALPLRLKEVHIINNPKLFKVAWQILKPLIREKLYGRIYFHQNDLTSLHKFIDADVLPEDFGGVLPKITYSGKDWYPIIQQHDDFIKKWCSCGKI